MGYTIQYEPDKNRKYPTRTAEKRNITMHVLAALIIVVCLGIGLRAGWLIPGDPQVTADAFSLMVDKLTEGERVGDALTAFCSEVLEHGNPN